MARPDRRGAFAPAIEAVTVFGDVDDKKSFLVAQGDALVICGRSQE